MTTPGSGDKSHVGSRCGLTPPRSLVVLQGALTVSRWLQAKAREMGISDSNEEEDQEGHTDDEGGEDDQRYVPLEPLITLLVDVTV